MKSLYFCHIKNKMKNYWKVRWFSEKYNSSQWSGILHISYNWINKSNKRWRNWIKRISLKNASKCRRKCENIGLIFSCEFSLRFLQKRSPKYADNATNGKRFNYSFSRKLVLFVNNAFPLAPYKLLALIYNSITWKHFLALKTLDLESTELI